MATTSMAFHIKTVRPSYALMASTRPITSPYIGHHHHKIAGLEKRAAWLVSHIDNNYDKTLEATAFTRGCVYACSQKIKRGLNKIAVSYGRTGVTQVVSPYIRAT
eukprot:1186844-Prorocentrum_minimum.AAC.2